MGYSEFTLTSLRRTFGLEQQRLPLFPKVSPVEIASWLAETLKKSRQLIVDTEKARSELLVMPILLAARDDRQQQFAIYSGETLDADPEKGLKGECDFILTNTPPLAEIQAPIMMLVEAKKNDIDGSLGQCAAQMLGARVFNQKDDVELDTIFGCVTTGEAWQFLKLEQNVICIDQNRYYIDRLETILGIFHIITEPYHPSEDNFSSM